MTGGGVDMGHDQGPGVAEAADSGGATVGEITLVAISERANAAAPGPWRVRNPDPTVLDSLAESWACASGEEVREFPGAAWIDGPEWIDCTDTGLFFDPADAVFCAYARTDVPVLVAAVRRLAAENATLRSPMDRCDEEGEPVPPRGWVPVDGGRLDELEAAEAEVERLRAAGQRVIDAVDKPASPIGTMAFFRLDEALADLRGALHPRELGDG